MTGAGTQRSLLHVREPTHLRRAAGLEQEEYVSEHNTFVAIYDAHTEAEAAIHRLARAVFTMMMVSIMGRNYHTNKRLQVEVSNRRYCLLRRKS